MDRRRFTKIAFTAIPAGVTLLTTTAHALERILGDEVAPCDAREAQSADLKSFAYYQALNQTEMHDIRRTDGTSYQMPCIARADICGNTEKTYKFWHGHNNMDHHFTLTADDFAKLRNGESVVVYTDMVTGHRHALTINPSVLCQTI